MAMLLSLQVGTAGQYHGCSNTDALVLTVAAVGAAQADIVRGARRQLCHQHAGHVGADCAAGAGADQVRAQQGHHRHLGGHVHRCAACGRKGALCGAVWRRRAGAAHAALCCALHCGVVQHRPAKAACAVMCRIGWLELHVTLLHCPCASLSHGPASHPHRAPVRGGLPE